MPEGSGFWNGPRPRILYIQCTNPAEHPPLQHSSRILVNAEWDVLLLGTDSLGSKFSRFPPDNGATVRRMSFGRTGWRQKLHYLLFVFWAMGWTLRWRPKWVYVRQFAPVLTQLSAVG